MAQNLVNALLITAIGMGLVFVVILMLWGLMALVALIRDPEEAVAGETAAEAPEAGEAEIAPVADEAALMAESGEGSMAEHKRRAAAIAVAIALQLTQSRAGAVPAAPRAGLSPWQAVSRSTQIQNKQLRSRVR